MNTPVYDDRWDGGSLVHLRNDLRHLSDMAAKAHMQVREFLDARDSGRGRPLTHEALMRDRKFLEDLLFGVRGLEAQAREIVERTVDGITWAQGTLDEKVAVYLDAPEAATHGDGDELRLI
jgi:hypothetical protein